MKYSEALAIAAFQHLTTLLNISIKDNGKSKWKGY